MDDDFDPGCTKTLFVGNIEKTTTYGDLKEAFERFGEVLVRKRKKKNLRVEHLKNDGEGGGVSKGRKNDIIVNH